MSRLVDVGDAILLATDSAPAFKEVLVKWPWRWRVDGGQDSEAHEY